MEKQEQQLNIAPEQIKRPKWLIAIIIVVGVIVLGLIVWGGYELLKPTPEESVVEDEFKDWQTYRNEEYGFEMKFPESWSDFGFETYKAGRGLGLGPGWDNDSLEFKLYSKDEE